MSSRKYHASDSHHFGDCQLPTNHAGFSPDYSGIISGRYYDLCFSKQLAFTMPRLCPRFALKPSYYREYRINYIIPLADWLPPNASVKRLFHNHFQSICPILGQSRVLPNIRNALLYIHHLIIYPYIKSARLDCFENPDGLLKPNTLSILPCIRTN